MRTTIALILTSPAISLEIIRRCLNQRLKIIKTNLYKLIELKTGTLFVQNLFSRSPLRHSLFLIALVLACFAFSPMAQGQLSPPPDGGYPNNNTAEGEDALFSLDISQGLDNTAVGFQALFSNTTGYTNTANGSSALFSNTTGNDNTANGCSSAL